MLNICELFLTKKILFHLSIYIYFDRTNYPLFYFAHLSKYFNFFKEVPTSFYVFTVSFVCVELSRKYSKLFSKVYISSDYGLEPKWSTGMCPPPPPWRPFAFMTNRSKASSVTVSRSIYIYLPNQCKMEHETIVKGTDNPKPIILHCFHALDFSIFNCFSVIN